MIKNIKIIIILILLWFQNLWNLIHLFTQKIMKMFVLVFPIIFQSSMGLRKSKCDIPSGNMQGWACPKW